LVAPFAFNVNSASENDGKEFYYLHKLYLFTKYTAIAVIETPKINDTTR
jgi:hypothetical protein